MAPSSEDAFVGALAFALAFSGSTRAGIQCRSSAASPNHDEESNTFSEASSMVASPIPAPRQVSSASSCVMAVEQNR